MGPWRLSSVEAECRDEGVAEEVSLGTEARVRAVDGDGLKVMTLSFSSNVTR